ncbi:MAG: hypothetical protein ACK49J_07590 [Verrucomicrobiota bacterium]
MSRQNPLRFGVNYIPSKNWWYSWQDWDEGSVSDDLAAIAGLELDHIRIQCLWPVFQPNRHFLNNSALDRLSSLVDMAYERGLSVQIAVLDGWLSGFTFFPEWKDGRNMFTHPDMIAAEKALFKGIADRVGSHPGFLGFDLGNELSVLVEMGEACALSEGDRWASDMLSFCEDLAPGKFHVNGVDHCPWFWDTAFSRRGLANTGAASSLHTWTKFTKALDLYGPLGTGSVHLAEYCVELANAYADDPTRPVWIQEFGASSLWMSHEEIPEFAEKTIRNAATCRNVWGFTWWCSHDIPSHFSDFDPMEYDLGLLTTANEVKPAGARVKQLIREFRTSLPTAIDRPDALILPDGLLAEPQAGPRGWQFARRYMQCLEEGFRPAIVLESRASDSAYLASRGIRNLIGGLQAGTCPDNNEWISSTLAPLERPRSFEPVG